MKREILGLISALLLLTGCAKPVPEPSVPVETPEVQTAAPTPVPTPSPTPAPEAQTTAPTPVPTPSPTPTPEPADDAMVYVRDVDGTILAELRYAAENNFTGTVIYDFTQPQLRCGTAKKLAAAQKALLEQSYGLLIWDAYRPVEAQFRLWEVCPDSTYVANPNTGYSSHSRGSTVDVTLVALDGSPVEMPSDFDEFSALADRDYSDVSATAAEHARLLEDAMTAAGFTGYSGEWWHFSDTTEYPVVG